MKTTWFEQSPQERIETIINLESEMGLDDNNIEKDFWLTLVLAATFDFPEADEKLVFCGGSSLSKSYGLIQRFSEDIDLAIKTCSLGFGENLSRRQINKKLRQASFDFVNGELYEFLGKELSGLPCKVNMIDAATPTLKVDYETLFAAKNYNPPSIKIEVEGRFISSPARLKSVTTPVDPTLMVEAPSLLPASTIIQKVFLLHEGLVKFPEKFKTQRTSRHMYDIVEVWPKCKEEITKPAFYKESVDLRLKYHHRGLTTADYSPETVAIVPEGDIGTKLEQDYKIMQDTMIYDPKAPKFSELLEKLTEIQDEIRKIKF